MDCCSGPLFSRHRLTAGETTINFKRRVRTESCNPNTMSDPNSVGRLQEWTQKKNIPPPNYVETVSSDGSFLASVTILGMFLNRR